MLLGARGRKESRNERAIHPPLSKEASAETERRLPGQTGDGFVIHTRRSKFFDPNVAIMLVSKKVEVAPYYGGVPSPGLAKRHACTLFTAATVLLVNAAAQLVANRHHLIPEIFCPIFTYYVVAVLGPVHPLTPSHAGAEGAEIRD